MLAKTDTGLPCVVMEKIFGKIILVDSKKYEKDLIELALNKKNWDADVDYYMNAEEAIEHLRKYKQEEILKMSSDLVSMTHRVRSGKGDLEVMLEKWILGI